MVFDQHTRKILNFRECKRNIEKNYHYKKSQNCALLGTCTVIIIPNRIVNCSSINQRCWSRSRGFWLRNQFKDRLRQHWYRYEHYSGNFKIKELNWKQITKPVPSSQLSTSPSLYLLQTKFHLLLPVRYWYSLRLAHFLSVTLNTNFMMMA